MKTALLFLFAAIVFLGLIYSRIDVWFNESTIDIHVHDTYFVIARWHAIFFIILFLGTFSFIGGIIGTKFQNKIFMVLLLIFLVVDFYIFWNFYNSFHHSQNFAQPR
jgi:heme/copper-type cytochrome/quinol oxidase subunit 1